MNISAYDHTDGVDIYLFDDATNHPISGGGYGMTEGVGLTPNLMVTGSFEGDLDYLLVRSFVLAHEMGYVFNLWHTRHGTVNESGDPNAANNELNLDLTNKPAGLYVYELYDSNGIVVAFGDSPNVLETINTSGLGEGVYFLHFYEEGTLTIKQVVIDHQ